VRQYRMNASSITQLATGRIVLKRLADGEPMVADKADAAALRLVWPAPGALRRPVPVPDTSGSRPTKPQTLTFAIEVERSGVVAGLASLSDVDLEHARAALGPLWTTSVLPDAVLISHTTYLLLQFGLDVLGWQRIELRTATGADDARKTFSTFGFRREGVLRSYEIGADGESCDLTVWSVIQPQWHDVSARLQAAMARADAPWGDRLPSIMPP
jgi:RimJ/RimL family protein N-acetyltransferase